MLVIAAWIGLSNVDFHCGYIEELPGPDGWADVIISNGAVNLAPDEARVFGEMRRVLRPDGCIESHAGERDERQPPAGGRLECVGFQRSAPELHGAVRLDLRAHGSGRSTSGRWTTRRSSEEGESRA